MAASGGVEPTRPWDVGFYVGIFFEERNETRPGVAAGALGLIVVPVIVPGNLDVLGDAAHEPVSYVEGECVLHGGAGDAGSIEVVEHRHIGAGGAKFFDTRVEGVEQMLDARD